MFCPSFFGFTAFIRIDNYPSKKFQKFFQRKKGDGRLEIGDGYPELILSVW